jgi:hypothetical protein
MEGVLVEAALVLSGYKKRKQARQLSLTIIEFRLIDPNRPQIPLDVSPDAVTSITVIP